MADVPKLNQLTFLPKLRLVPKSLDVLPVGTRVQVVSEEELIEQEDRAPTVSEEMLQYADAITTIVRQGSGNLNTYRIALDNCEWSWHRDWLIVLDPEPALTRLKLLREPRIDGRHQALMERHLLRTPKP